MHKHLLKLFIGCFSPTINVQAAPDRNTEDVRPSRVQEFLPLI